MIYATSGLRSSSSSSASSGGGGKAHKLPTNTYVLCVRVPPCVRCPPNGTSGKCIRRRGVEKKRGAISFLAHGRWFVRRKEEKFAAVFAFSSADFFFFLCTAKCISWKVIWTCRGRRFFRFSAAASSLMNGKCGDFYFFCAGGSPKRRKKHMFCILLGRSWGKSAQRSEFPNAIFISFIQAIK